MNARRLSVGLAKKQNAALGPVEIENDAPETEAISNVISNDEPMEGEASKTPQ